MHGDRFSPFPFMEYEPLYQVSSIVAILLGISLLLAGPLLSLNGWIAVLGFLLLGASGPFAFVYLGGNVRGPLRRLVRSFGFALPGLALISAGLIIWHLHNDLRRPVLTMLGICMIFGGVWFLTFATSGIYQYVRKRKRRHWRDEDIKVTIDSGSRKRPGSYEAQTLVIGMLTLVATIFGDIIPLVR